MMSAEMVTPGLLKITVFWNKGYDVIISVHDVTNKILLRDSNYIVDVVMWPKFSNSSSSIREVIITSNLKDLIRKITRLFWFTFNDLGLVLGKKLTYYTSVAKGLKLNVTRFLGLTLAFLEVTEKKLVGVRVGVGNHPHPTWIGLRVGYCCS